MFRKTLASSRFCILPKMMVALLAGAVAAQSQTMPAALPEDLLPELKSLLDTAVKNSPTTLARNLEVAAADANYIVDRSGLLPTLSGYGSYAATESAFASNPDATSENDGFFYGVSVSQPIFHWGALKAQADIGKLNLRLAEKNYAETYRTLSLSIRAQYLTLIQKKMLVRNYRYAVRVAESNLSLQEARLRDGRISSGEIIAPRLAVEEARIYAERAQTDYDYTRRLLATTTGVDEIRDESIPEAIPRPVYAPETLGAYFESLKAQGPENTIMAAYYQDYIRQSDLRYKIARVRLLPKFSFSAGYSQNNQTAFDGNSIRNESITSTTYSVSGYWTLFDGLASRGAKLSALAAKRLAERNYDSYLKSTSEQVRLLERQIGFAGRLMDLTETRKDLALAAVRKVTDDVRSGVTSQTTLENFTASANKAELEALSARAEFLSRWSEYVSVLGVDPILGNVSPRYLRNGK